MTCCIFLSLPSCLLPLLLHTCPLFAAPAIANVDNLDYHFIGRLETCIALAVYTCCVSSSRVHMQGDRGCMYAAHSTDACSSQFRFVMMVKRQQSELTALQAA
jgi:hypothetical protein